MNKQEIFDKVATHLFTQGKPAIEDQTCKYRDSEGNSCAVGCLIPDEMYTPKLDDFNLYSKLPMDKQGTGIRQHLDNNVIPLPDFINSENLNLLIALQSVHDDGAYWEDNLEMKIALKRVAKSYCLDYSILDNLKFKGR